MAKHKINDTQRRIYAISKNNIENDNGEKIHHLNYALKVIQKNNSLIMIARISQ